MGTKGKAKGMKEVLRCLECDKTFVRKIGWYTIEVKCPKCGSYDIDLAVPFDQSRQRIFLAGKQFVSMPY